MLHYSVCILACRLLSEKKIKQFLWHTSRFCTVEEIYGSSSIWGSLMLLHFSYEGQDVILAHSVLFAASCLRQRVITFLLSMVISPVLAEGLTPQVFFYNEIISKSMAVGLNITVYNIWSTSVLAAICISLLFYHDTFYKSPHPSFSSLLSTILILHSDQSYMTQTSHQHSTRRLHPPVLHSCHGLPLITNLSLHDTSFPPSSSLYQNVLLLQSKCTEQTDTLGCLILTTEII